MVDGDPTCRYQLGGVEVAERITPLDKVPVGRAAQDDAAHEGQAGFKRTLHFSGLKKDLWFFSGETRRTEVLEGRGEWEGNYYRIPAGDGTATFTLIVKDDRSEEHTSELQSLMRISYAVFCLKKTKKINI